MTLAAAEYSPPVKLYRAKDGEGKVHLAVESEYCPGRWRDFCGSIAYRQRFEAVDGFASDITCTKCKNVVMRVGRTEG